MAEMYKDTCEVAQQMTPFMQEEVRAASKGDKVRIGQGEKITHKSHSAVEPSPYSC